MSNTNHIRENCWQALVPDGKETRALTREMLEIALNPRVRAVEDCLANSGLCVIACEPHTGKSALSRTVSERAGRLGMYVRVLDLADASEETVSGKIFRVSRDISSYHPDRKVLVCIDDMPILDYPYGDDVTRAIRGLVERGCSVLVTMRPEASHLLEGLPGANVFGAEDVTCDYDCLERGTGDESLAMDLLRLTNGIPSLLAAICGEDLSSGPGVRYWRVLEKVVSLSLREELMAEEVMIRCAMLLLGSGDVEDIRAVCGRIDEGLLVDIAKEAPLFGVDIRAGTFRCAGSHDPKGIESCVQPIRTALEDRPELSAKAIGLLVERREYARAASVGWICPGSDDAMMLVGDPVEFINVGESVRLADAVEEIDGRPESYGPEATEGLRLSKLALSSIGASELAADEEAGALGFDGEYRLERQLEQVRALLACDMATRELSHGILDLMREGEDPLAASLRLHARSLKLIASGKFDQAFRLLLGSGATMPGVSLSKALLFMDFEVAGLFVGDVSDSNRAVHMALGSFLAESGLEVPAMMFRATRPALLAMLGIGGEVNAIERAIVVAQAKGMHVLEAMLLLAVSIADLRRSVNTRAHVRANAAEAAAARCGSTYLARVARMVDDIAIRRLGGAQRAIGRPSRAEQYSPAGIDIVEQLYISARKGKRPKLSGNERVILSQPCPRDILCVLDMLLREGGEVGVRLSGLLPETWRAAVADYGGRVRGAVEGEHSEWPVAAVGKSALLDSIRHANLAIRPSESFLEISLLGGFSMRYGGAIIDQKGLDRRKAKALLTLLAAKRGHQLGRGEAVDSFWPGGEYADVRQKVYEATSAIRRALRAASVPDNALVSELGSLFLNPSCVVCDTDVLEDIGIEMLASDGDDQRIVTLGNAMAKVYGGDLYCPANESTGTMILRREELRNIFVDSMLAATRAALRLGLGPKAAEFSRKAKSYAPLREDVMMARMQALHMTGRSSECAAEYEQFFRTMVVSTGEPPAAVVRDLAKELRVSAKG